ncbi:unnamed protein product [Prorocentrum cordatum]|uniref:Uncharacterized protein n=1 Tax=Prorocentrum cordatum TaxID=2364126 RepID=A0ABN9T762_9DINO|nr:unnamed protein product [Polarella glacialis]
MSGTFALGEAEREFWNATRRFDRPGLPSPPAAALGPSGAAASGKWPRADSPGFLTMCPLDIGFCQDSISPAFRNGSSILATLRQLADCSMDIREMPPMQVVLHDEKFFSVSNRRLCLYRLCQLLGLLRAVKVQLLQGPPPHFEQKLTTPCEGAWVRVRGDGRICGRTLEETTFGREELLSPASPG